MVRGDVAYVSNAENVLAAGQMQGSLTALNVFGRQPDGLTLARVAEADGGIDLGEHAVF